MKSTVESIFFHRIKQPGHAGQGEDRTPIQVYDGSLRENNKTRICHILKDIRIFSTVKAAKLLFLNVFIHRFPWH